MPPANYRMRDPRYTDRIREACREVSELARWVKIDKERLQHYAGELPLARAMHPAHDADCHYLGRGEGTLAFFITLNCINFTSGYNPHLKKRPGRSGYFTIAGALNDHFRLEGPLSAEALGRLTAADCAGLFGQDMNQPVAAELMLQFAEALNVLGNLLRDRYDGSFESLAAAADHSAERLIRLLLDMPYYRDVAEYGGIQVPFLKRAQITAADLHLAFGGMGMGRFEDIDRLTMFADNLVPHVLRMLGVLVYDERLALRIDREDLIPSGSREEIEIRAVALHAVEQLRERCRKFGFSAPSHALDRILWTRGQHPDIKARPRHRTRCTYY